MAAAAEMRMAETHDRTVIIMISGTPFIALLKIMGIGLRAGLDHTERHTRPRIGMAVSTGPDKRIHIFAKIFDILIVSVTGYENEW